MALITISLAGCFGDVNDVGSNGPDARTVDVKTILSQWSGCMTMTNFQTANMMHAWSTLASNDGKACQGCHSDAQFGFMATDDEGAFFTGISQHSALMAMYFTVDLATEKVIVNKQSFASANSALGHPRFNTTMNAGMTALETFYAATLSNSPCGTARMID